MAPVKLDSPVKVFVVFVVMDLLEKTAKVKSALSFAQLLTLIYFFCSKLLVHCGSFEGIWKFIKFDSLDNQLSTEDELMNASYPKSE